MMKLSELVFGQKAIVQMLWGEQKIEFDTEVLINDSTGVYIAPYKHKGGILELNVIPGRGVICNLFTDDYVTKQRISWKNIELQTVDKNNDKLYLISTSGYNSVAENDDRRTHDRIMIRLNAKVKDPISQIITDVMVHDISDIGISFYAPNSFSPKASQLVVTFEDIVDGKNYNIKVECVMVRSVKKAGNILVGCKITGENKDYLIYSFIMRLRDKSRLKGMSPNNIDTGESIDNQDENTEGSEITILDESPSEVDESSGDEEKKENEGDESEKELEKKSDKEPEKEKK